MGSRCEADALTDDMMKTLVVERDLKIKEIKICKSEK